METIEKLLNVFEQHKGPALPQDVWSTTGRTLLGTKFETFVSQQKPIEFVMLGFPFKSPNTKHKVLGTRPDLGEELALKNFIKFSEQMNEVYAPGVKVNMVSDGFVFADALGVPTKTVEEYQEINQATNPDIVWWNLRSFYSGSLESAKAKLDAHFGISEEELQRRILLNPDVNALYRGMIKFASGDLKILDFSSGTQLQKASKQLAKRLMLDNEKYSNLVSKEFANSVRISMHSTINNGKYAFQLIPGRNIWSSPWHCAMLLDENTVDTIHREAAEAQGYELVYRNSQPYYFIPKSN